jgi:WD40 repeat protein
VRPRILFLSLSCVHLEFGHELAKRRHSPPFTSPSVHTMELSLLLHWIQNGSLLVSLTPRLKYSGLESGVLTRTLQVVGHESGVWGLCLVSSGGNKLDDSHREDIPGVDSTERHARKGGTTTSEEEDLLDAGVDQGKNPDKPSNLCFASQGWGQPNSLIVSGGCDKVVRVWDIQSG